MRYRSIAAFLLVGLLLPLPACGFPSAGESTAEPSETPVATTEVQRNAFALACDTNDTLHPLEAGATNLTLAPLVYEGLFALDTTFSPQPVLCQSYQTSADGLTWTFLIRSGVTFSDGTALTAAHVAAALNAARTSALYAARMTGISAVTAGEGAVTVTLTAPNGGLPALLDLPVFLSAGTETPLGTGPYVFTQSGEEPELTANPNWWQSETLPLSSIPLRSTLAADDRIAAFDTGRVTLVTTDLTGTNALGYSGNYETWDYPTSTMLYVGFNTREGFCSDPLLRQALSRGFDRVSVVSSLLSGHADAAVLPVSPLSPLYDQTLAEEQSYSIPAAEQLLTDGGYQKSDASLTKGGKKVSLSLVVNSENTFKTALADHLAAELSKLGISVTVRKLNWDDYLSALESGDFDLYLGQVKLTADFDLTGLLTGSLNFSGYSNASVAALSVAFRASSGAARATAAYALYAQLATELPFTPLCFQRHSVLTQWGAVSGLTPTQQNPFYQIQHWTLSQ